MKPKLMVWHDVAEWLAAFADFSAVVKYRPALGPDGWNLLRIKHKNQSQMLLCT